ncbi:50S ribosomal protein L30e [Candidatus Micrarchaeota archaeon]|nr:50S ribosomal protein L30e [Candidatus Micrarchaeota archaeon]
MDLIKSIRLAVDTGKVDLGAQSAKRHALNGSSSLIILAKNCPAQVRNDVTHYAALSEVKLLEFAGTSLELGNVCGKPFPVSALSVLEAGNSDILSGE